MMSDTLFFVASVAVVAVGMGWIRVWPAAFADLLWMIVMRPLLVGGVCLLVAAGLLTLAELFMVDGLGAFRLLLLLALGPLVARPLADFVAYRRDEADGGSRHYVFRWKLAKLEASYREAMGLGAGSALRR